MRRAARGLVTVPIAVVLASAGMAAVPALAAPVAPAPRLAPGAHTVILPLAAANWFSRTQVSDVGGLGVGPPAAAPDPTVPAGDLAVAGPTSDAPDADTGGAVQAPVKEAYVAFRLGAVPAGVHVTKVEVVVPIDLTAPQGVVPGQQPKIVACAVVGSWSSGDGNESFSGRPGTRCGAKPPVRRLVRGGRAYAFDVTAIAADWFGPTGLNNGVALTDDPSNTNMAYQVDFGPRAKITAALTYVVAAAPTPAPPHVPGGDGTGGVTGVGDTTGGSVGSVPPPGLGTGSVPPPPAPAPQESPVVQPPPVTTAAAADAATTSPGLGFWVVAALLAVLLVIVGVVLHNPAPPAPATQRRGVGRALLRTVVASPSTPRSTP